MVSLRCVCVWVCVSLYGACHFLRSIELVMKYMTMDELYRILREADDMIHATDEELLFNEAVIEALGYYPNWYDMTVH